MNELVVDHFHFLRPWWWLALVPALLLSLSLWRARGSSEQWSKFISPRFLPYLLEGSAERIRRWPLLGLFALWFAAVAALAGPVWKKIPQPVAQSISSVVICWDMSPSMLANDLKPSRLDRSRLKIIDFLRSHRDGQTGLIAYSAEAYVVTPLTDDHQTIINLLPALSPTTLPSSGSNPEMAFDEAEKLLKEAGSMSGHIVLVTDGISADAFDYLQNKARNSLYKLTIWAVGTEEGAPIPLPNGGFAKDRGGDMIVARMNQSEMTAFASRAGAYYVPMAISDDDDLGTLRELLSNRELQTELIARVFDQWYEHGHWLTLLLLPFVAALFRRGWLFSLALCLPLGLPSAPVQALEWKDLWMTRDQQAQQKLTQGDTSAAAQLFTTPERRGSAFYEGRNYEAAAREFSRTEEGEAAYNEGTALTRAGQYEKAIEAFNDVLARQPDHESALHNREIARQLAELAKQQSQQQGQKPQDSGGNSGETDPDSGNQQSQGGQSDSQQSRDGQPQDAGQQGDGEQNPTESAGSGEQADADNASRNEDALSKGDSDPDSDKTAEPGTNPFSEAADKQEGQAASRQSPADGKDDRNNEDETQGAAGIAGAEADTEEQQMLEQMLRKIPDDPSGLLRNKFRYQYLQRKQTLQYQSPLSGDQAENRW